MAKGSNGGSVQLGYVSKLAGPTGAVMWTQGDSSGGVYYFVTGVSADPSGNVLAVGDFQGRGNTSGTTYMIAKLSGADGSTQWQQGPVTFSRYGYQNQIYTQVSLNAQGDIFLGGLDASSGYSQCTVAQLANDTGSAAMASEIWCGTVVRPRQCGGRYRRQRGDGRQHVSPVLFEHQPGGNERCVCG